MQQQQQQQYGQYQQQQLLQQPVVPPQNIYFQQPQQQYVHYQQQQLLQQPVVPPQNIYFQQPQQQYVQYQQQQQQQQQPNQQQSGAPPQQSIYFQQPQLQYVQYQQQQQQQQQPNQQQSGAPQQQGQQNLSPPPQQCDSQYQGNNNNIQNIPKQQQQQQQQQPQSKASTLNSSNLPSSTSSLPHPFSKQPSDSIMKSSPSIPSQPPRIFQSPVSSNVPNLSNSSNISSSSNSSSQPQPLCSLQSSEIIKKLEDLKKRVGKEKSIVGKKKITVDDFEPVLENAYWDVESFNELKRHFSKNEIIYKIVVAYFTTRLLPTYKELRITSDKELEMSAYNNPDKYYVLKEKRGKDDDNKISMPYPVVGRSKKYTSYGSIDFITTHHKFPKTVVKVFCEETLPAAKILKDENEHNVCVLSMANPNIPGGTWKSGKFGQEESLFVGTTLSCGIDESFYPLDDCEHPRYDSVFVKDVIVIRSGKDEGYEFLTPGERYTIDVVSMCGLNLGENESEEMNPEQINIVRLKIRSILLACIENDVSNLVLGAIGCGEFKNDPVVVAKIFEAELTVFAGFFNKVYFAIRNKETEQKFKNVLVGEGNTEREYTPHVDWFHENVVPTFGSFTKCDIGSKCTDTSPDHFRKRDHLPLCYDIDNCNSDDHVHKLCFRHKEECPFKSFCTKYGDKEHDKYFKHEKYPVCPNIDVCKDTTPEHLSKYRHKR